jgi:probable rRNA maturation factor
VIPRVDVDAGGGGWPSRATVRTLARRVRRAARAMGCTRAQLDALELRIVDDARMRVLKERHFGVAEATDVLSFPAGEPIPGQEDEVGESLGEIVINRDAVTRQAARPGVTGWLDEATALAIHGVAHLRGHDHDRRDRARHMLRCETRGSRAVGLPCTRPYGGRTPARPRFQVSGPAAPWSEGGAPEELERAGGAEDDDASDESDESERVDEDEDAFDESDESERVDEAADDDADDESDDDEGDEANDESDESERVDDDASDEGDESERVDEAADDDADDEGDDDASDDDATDDDELDAEAQDLDEGDPDR